NTNLPNRFKASEMPDKVKQWINELQIAAEHSDNMFIKKLLLAYKVLSTNEFNDLTNKIKCRLVKVLETFKQ
ncbi:263_t:CDS:1, partial [Cetraspora pellucida]